MNSQTLYEIILSVLENEATDDERRLLAAWLEESDTHKEEFEKIKRFYRTSLSSQKTYRYDTEQAWKKVYAQTIGKKKNFILYTFVRYAAVIAVLLSSGILYYATRTTEPVSLAETIQEPTLLLESGEKIALNSESFSRKRKEVIIKNEAEQKLVYESTGTERPETVKNNRLIIPKGKTYQVVLADGTKVRLNSETELIYPAHFTGDKREVTLSGEAFFEVAPDKHKPFYVKTNGLEVKVLGTVFNVCSYKEDKTIRTTLVEGSVSVRPERGEAQVITPSQQFSFEKESGKSDIRTVDTQLYTSWVHGQYIFRDAPLGVILTKLQRWYDFSVSYQEESLQCKRFSLTVDRATDLDRLLEIISFTSEVKLERKGTSINIKKEEEKSMP